MRQGIRGEIDAVIEEALTVRGVLVRLMKGMGYEEEYIEKIFLEVRDSIRKAMEKVGGESSRE